MPSVEIILLLIVGVAFLAVGLFMSSRKGKEKSTERRLADIYKDYNKQMNKYRK